MTRDDIRVVEFQAYQEPGDAGVISEGRTVQRMDGKRGETVSFEILDSDLLKLITEGVKGMETTIDEAKWDYDSDPGDAD